MTDTLRAGEWLTALASHDGRCTLEYQGDGNLVLYASGAPLWDSRTAGQTVGQAVMQGDGNFVVYDADGHAVWDSKTAGHSGASLHLRNDGILVVSGPDGAALWSSGAVAPVGEPVSPRPVHPPAPALPAAPPPMPSIPSAGGGFLEHASSTAVRLPATDLGFLPGRPGPFQFPAPYGTRGVRLTSDEDGEILPRNYSYWPNVSLPDGEGARYVFVGRAAALPLLLRVSASGVVARFGVLPHAGEAEGWYFSARHSTTLYVTVGTRLLRYDVLSGAEGTVLDAGETHPGCRLWQAHSSDDGETHCATVERCVDDGPFKKLGSVVSRRGEQAFFPAVGILDECALDTTGRYLVIKEEFQRDRLRLDNRFIDLETRETRTLRDEDGAVGHSDCGAGVVIGEDDQREPGALVAWDLASPFTPERRRLLYHQAQWEGGMGHVAVRGDRILVSNSHQENLPRLNELLLVQADGSLRYRVLCPNLIDPATADYDDRPKANLSPDGAVAFWIGNAHGRRDAFMVQL